MTTICIPLHPDGGKYKDNSELRYSLRSLERNFIGDFEVAIVSRHLPDWVQGVKHVYGEGLKSSLRTAAREFPDGFFWWYDDNCLLIPTDQETMKRTPVANGWSKPQTEWRKQLDSVRMKLEEAGIEAVDYSSPHGPYWFDQDMVEEGFTSLEKMSGKFPWESWILSVRQWPWVKGQTCQFYGRFKSAPKAHHRYLNYNDDGNTDELRRWLDGVFHEPSRFEKPDPEFSYTGRVRGVVIGMMTRPRWEESCIASLAPVGIDAEVFHGTDMHAEDCPVMGVDAAKFRKEFKREPLAGEIGCYSSHVSLAMKFDELPPFCEDKPEWRLVFEDDALPVNVSAASLHAIVTMAEEGGYDLVLLNTGKKNRRGNRPMSISPTRRSDPFTHAYIMNEKAAKEISRWTMRHPIDLAISKANRIKVGLLGGRYRFDQRRPRDSDFSIHRERKGETPKPVAGKISVEVVTIRYGDAEWLRVCSETLDDWCERHGMPLTVLGKGPENLPCPKFQIVEVLKRFVEESPHTHLAYVDADVFVHPEAPEPPVGDGLSAMNDRSHDGWDRDWRGWCREIFGHDPRSDSKYYNAGLWFISKEAAKVLVRHMKEPFVERVQEQHAFNYWIDRAKSEGMRIDLLHPTWNRDPGVLRNSWMFHLWGSGCKMAKLDRIRRAGLLIPRSSGSLVVADCGRGRNRGLGNLLTTICGGYAAARSRGDEFAVHWRPGNHCQAEWGDLFESLEGVNFVKEVPSGAIRFRTAWYGTHVLGEHHAAAGLAELDDGYWSYWREMARKIRLRSDLVLPEAEPFDAISIRMLHPNGFLSEKFVEALPDLRAPFVASDCRRGFELVKERFPDAWSLDPPLYQNDRQRRELGHMRGAVRDMMMLCKSRRIFAVGRESTFRNLAFMGYGVPVFNLHNGMSP